MLEGRAGGITQKHSGRRQCQTTSVPHEQGLAQVGLKRLYLPADGAMGDMQLPTRTGHAFQAGGGLESVQGIERGQFSRHL